ncbi:MAG: chromosomal replication initiator protein DnaA [Candidatus Eisenbacteria bacterium]|uniref:Chromosomal replication initiator protein DnaA n=1 Tax=Eiseniibacteriota bacterium TaxID=2212470 RepID=A0A538SJB9_UNCEI|nr:MAG: chromosomal replication initiator protein DnaA [Candidatus Eisenbacteria bacterium]
MAVQNVQLEEITQLWEQVLSSVKTRLESTLAYETWFKPIVPLEISPQSVELEVPNTLFADWMHEHHLPTLRHSLNEVLGASPEVRFLVREGAVLPSVDVESDPEGPEPASNSPAPRITVGRTFETFVVGSGNRFTHAACVAVAQKPGYVYNPVFIFGDSGLGKTHLLHAIEHEVRKGRPDARVCYLPAERFTNEMIYSIRHAQTLAFRNKYRNVDVLLIDDIQFLAGKESTQEEFFYTFNALRDAHKQIVVTADKPPKDLPMLEERLTSRFNQGLVTDIKQPDLETRIAILRNYSSAIHGERFGLPDDVLLLIADRIRNNIRDLEGCLVRLVAVASVERREMTLELAEEVLQNYVNPEPDETAPDRIISVVSERFGIQQEALCGKRRTHSVVLPRQIAMYLLRQLTDLSLVEIGRLFSGRDHTTVLYACQKIGGMASGDCHFAEKLNSLISTIASG